MSAIVKFVAPAELLFQPGNEKENAATKEDAKRVGPTSLCEPGGKFGKLSAKAPVPQVARVEMLVLTLFLLIAVVAIISCSLNYLVCLKAMLFDMWPRKRSAAAGRESDECLAWWSR